MRSVIADLTAREYSINRLLDHVEEVSEMRGKVEVVVVLKSSVFIALYNNIEATVYAVIERVHDSVSKLEYDDLTMPLRNKMLRYSFGKAANVYMQDPEKISLKEASLRAIGEKFPSLSDFLRRQSIFSGNIDARKLNIIGVSYGMPKQYFVKLDAKKMLWVKNKRNKIAHGEQSMSDGGQGIKTEDLRRAANAVSSILQEYIRVVESFITSQEVNGRSRVI